MEPTESVEVSSSLGFILTDLDFRRSRNLYSRPHYTTLVLNDLYLA